MDIYRPLQTRGETRCPGGVNVSCLASLTAINARDTTNYGSLTLDVDRHHIRSATIHQKKACKLNHVRPWIRHNVKNLDRNQYLLGMGIVEGGACQSIRNVKMHVKTLIIAQEVTLELSEQFF